METIAAISTPKGNGGIGIVRISGDESLKIANKLFKPYGKNNNFSLLEMPGYTAKLGKIVYKGEILDEAIALVFKSPKSYTGEDVVELSCHGGLFILNKILNAVINSGARLSMPGEFTKRAVLNGKMNTIQAEAVMSIINARSENAARLAILNKEGILNEKFSKIKKKLVHIIAKISVSIDYPEDEDFNNIDYKDLELNLADVLSKLKKISNTYESGKVLSYGIDTAIVGKPNVGKSSLMNALTDFEKSIITDIPGTTRDIVEETICFEDVILNLKDTAGIRESKDLIEKIGIEKSINKIKSAELVLALFDFAREISDEDLKILNLLKDAPNVIGIINKTDLTKKIDEKIIKSKIKTVVKISAKKNVGIEDLKKVVKQFVQSKITDPEEGALLTIRQKNSVEKCIGYIKDAINAVKNKVTLDLIMNFLDFALNEFLLLTGERISETVTDEVFSKFCVGK